MHPPQGSILGPDLYINGFSDSLTWTIPWIYVNHDTSIFASSYDGNELFVKINSDLAEARKCLMENKCTL